jgi:hypothetical protein
VEFLSDRSITGLLVAFVAVLLLYGLYLFIVVQSNRAVRRLALRGEPSAEGSIGASPNRRRLSLSAFWVISVLMATVCGLIGFMILLTHVSQ